MMKKALSSALIILATVSGACADLHWSKPGSDAGQVSRDLDACRASALQRSTPRAPAIASADTTGTGERGISAAGARPGGSSDERFIAEHEEIRTCMLRLGYQLRPAS
jgi:hypothetical protein